MYVLDALSFLQCKEREDQNFVFIYRHFISNDFTKLHSCFAHDVYF